MRFGSLVLALAGLGLSASFALAQAPRSLETVEYRVWDSYCTVGQFSQCVSVRAAFLPPVFSRPATATTPDLYITPISIWFENLEGRPDLPSTGGPIYGVRSFTFSGLLAEFEYGPRQQFALPSTYGDAFGRGVYDAYLYPELGELSIATDYGASHAWGCSQDIPWWDNFVYIGETPLSTCNGGYRFDLELAGRWQMTEETNLSFFGRYEDPATGGSIGFNACERAGDCISVPEPGSILLLLSGALGIAGVGLKRRSA